MSLTDTFPIRTEPVIGEDDPIYDNSWDRGHQAIQTALEVRHDSDGHHGTLATLIAGTYNGNGANSQIIPTDLTDLTIKYLEIWDAGQAYPYCATNIMPENTTKPLTELAFAADLILELGIGAFTVGSAANVLNATYWFFAHGTKPLTNNTSVVTPHWIQHGEAIEVDGTGRDIPGALTAELATQFLVQHTDAGLHRSSFWNDAVILATGHYTGNGLDSQVFSPVPSMLIRRAILFSNTVRAPAFALATLTGYRYYDSHTIHADGCLMLTESAITVMPEPRVPYEEDPLILGFHASGTEPFAIYDLNVTDILTYGGALLPSWHSSQIHQLAAQLDENSSYPVTCLVKSNYAIDVYLHYGGNYDMGWHGGIGSTSIVLSPNVWTPYTMMISKYLNNSWFDVISWSRTLPENNPAPTFYVDTITIGSPQSLSDTSTYAKTYTFNNDQHITDVPTGTIIFGANTTDAAYLTITHDETLIFESNFTLTATFFFIAGCAESPILLKGSSLNDSKNFAIVRTLQGLAFYCAGDLRIQTGNVFYSNAWVSIVIQRTDGVITFSVNNTVYGTYADTTYDNTGDLQIGRINAVADPVLFQSLTIHRTAYHQEFPFNAKDQDYYYAAWGTPLATQIDDNSEAGLYWTDLGTQFSQSYILSLASLGSGIALAGTCPDGKILRSTNSGATWTDLGTQFSPTQILSLASLGGGIVLAGTATDGKILRSTDSGATWTDLGTQFSQTYISILASLGGGIALAGTYPNGKILRSTHSGATWTDLGTQFSQTHIYSLASLGGGIALAGTYPDGKILRSTDSGATWTDLGTQFSQTQILSLASLGGGIVLAGTYPNGKILRSTVN